MSWHEKNNALEKIFTFKDFSHAMQAVNKIADLAEQVQHHPDLHIENYNTLRVILSTHSEGKVTEKDTKMAKQIDALF